jgi:hypothetical protein
VQTVAGEDGITTAWVDLTFAPTALVLPSGYLYGHLDAQTRVELPSLPSGIDQ